MSRIEWTRLSGDEVESVIAMFINREHPNSVRITPSRGDGGIDILDRRAGPEGSDVVYQVKKYANPLTSNQYTAVQDSLLTLKRDPRWADLNVVEWHLVLPWNPSPEAEVWLQALGDESGVTAIWNGLDFTDQLAAQYGDIVDYYLEGGASRIKEAYESVMALMAGRESAGTPTVQDVQERTTRALAVLDGDPHYRYEHSFGAGTPPDIASTAHRPGMVMRGLRCDPTKDQWSTVDVIARCAESVNQRPITVQGRTILEPGSESQQAYEDFLTYGVPFTSPEGAFDGELDAPGGLGGTIAGATIRIGPTADVDLGDDPEIRLDAQDVDGNVLVSVDVDRTERSEGLKGGLRTALTEIHGIFELELRLDVTANTSMRRFTLGEIVGLPVSVVHDAVKFLSLMRSPNTMRLRQRHAGAGQGFVDSNLGDGWNEETTLYMDAALQLLGTLAEFQAHASARIKVPALEKLPSSQKRNWDRAIAILQGREVVVRYPEGECLVIDLIDELPLPLDDIVAIDMPFAIEVGDQTVDLGRQILRLDNPTLVRTERHDDGTFVHVMTTPDRSLTWISKKVHESQAQNPTSA